MMEKKTLFLCGIGLLFPHTFQAQDITTEMREFDEFVRQQQKEFSDFVSEQNREFIQFLKENWKSYKSGQTGERPKRPEPVAPVTKTIPLLNFVYSLRYSGSASSFKDFI